MNMKEAEERLLLIIPEDMVFVPSFIRFHFPQKSENKPKRRVVTECKIWLGDPIAKHITDTTWQLVVDRVQARLQTENNTECPDLGFGDEGEG